jgi:hypothetical protein
MLITVLPVSAPSRAPYRQIRATTASTWSLRIVAGGGPGSTTYGSMRELIGTS